MMILLLMPMLPMSLPVLSHKKMVEYGKWATIYGMKEALRWEDGNYYSLPQDYADMNGWEETIENVADLNHTLDENKKSKTLLYASNYGQAGAIQLYHKKYNLPQPACFNGSFVFWLAYTIFVDRAIMVEDRPQDDSGFFKEISLITQVENPYARDKGYIYFGTDTIDGFAEKRKKSYI